MLAQFAMKRPLKIPPQQPDYSRPSHSYKGKAALVGSVLIGAAIGYKVTKQYKVAGAVAGAVALPIILFSILLTTSKPMRWS
jgi:hypothetical protein